MASERVRPTTNLELVQESPWRWRIEKTGAMRVPGVVLASPALLPAAAGTGGWGRCV